VGTSWTCNLSAPSSTNTLRYTEQGFRGDLMNSRTWFLALWQLALAMPAATSLKLHRCPPPATIHFTPFEALFFCSLFVNCHAVPRVEYRGQSQSQPQSLRRASAAAPLIAHFHWPRSLAGPLFCRCAAAPRGQQIKHGANYQEREHNWDYPKGSSSGCFGRHESRRIPQPPPLACASTIRILTRTVRQESPHRLT
jgi:hypothetical protein